MDVTNPEAPPPLRKDAARNRARLLQAGREVFAARGLDATLNDVARSAGVGVGTAYRHFANKTELIDAILIDQVTELEAILHESLAVPDAWEGLVSYLERSLAVQVRDRGMAQMFAGRHVEARRHDWERDRLAHLVNQVAARARSQGLIRAGITGTDLILIQIGVLGIAATLTDGRQGTGRLEEVYRRYLWIALDGIRARPGAPALPVAALGTEELHRVLARRPEGMEGHSPEK